MWAGGPLKPAECGEGSTRGQNTESLPSDCIQRRKIPPGAIGSGRWETGGKAQVKGIDINDRLGNIMLLTKKAFAVCRGPCGMLS